MASIDAPRQAAGPSEGIQTIVQTAMGLVKIAACVIVAGILMVVLDAHQSNFIVNNVTDAARWLAQPFDGIFSTHSEHGTIAANWGLAAAVYYVVAGFVSSRLRQ